MALIHCNFFSETLRISTSMDVILPQPPAIQPAAGRARRKPIPTLWLLHGLSDDHTIWQRRTSIERYVAPLNLAVVMPNGFRGFYTDMAHGYAYWTHLSEELAAPGARVLPALGGARGEFRRGAFDGRLRRVQAGAQAAGYVRRRRKPLGRARHGRERGEREERRVPGARARGYIRVRFGRLPEATTTCSRSPGSSRSRKARSRRSTNAAAPRTYSTRTTSGSESTPARSASTSLTKRGPARTTGDSGTCGFSACSNGCRCAGREAHGLPKPPRHQDTKNNRRELLSVVDPHRFVVLCALVVNTRREITAAFAISCRAGRGGAATRPAA